MLNQSSVVSEERSALVPAVFVQGVNRCIKTPCRRVERKVRVLRQMHGGSAIRQAYSLEPSAQGYRCLRMQAYPA